jgi:PAS domain S-box-containing protein
LHSYAVLDGATDAALDALVRVASNICETPIALVSLIDRDRQWFLSRHGLDARETPRDISFCGHVVFNKALLEVEDATLDPRFADNPLVTGAPNIRFYVGAPLVNDDGAALGTLCVIDRVSRKLSERQVSALTELSTAVMKLLEARKAEGARRAAEARADELSIDIRLVLDVMPAMVAYWDKSLRNRFANKMYADVLGKSSEGMRGLHFFDALGQQRLSEETRVAAHAALCGERQTFERTIDLPTKGTVDVLVDMVPDVREGEVRGFVTVVRDVSATRRAAVELSAHAEIVRDREARLRATFDGMAEGVVYQDATGQILECNSAAEMILSLSRDQLCGRKSIDPRWRAVRGDGTPFPGETHPAMVALRTGERSRNVPMGVHRPDGTLAWISINAEPMFAPGQDKPYAAITTFRDVTERVVQEVELASERALLSTALSSLPGAIVTVFDAELRVVRAFGNEVRARDVGGLFEPIHRVNVEAGALACLNGQASRIDASRGGKRFDLAFVPLELQGARRGLAVAYDVTERDALRDRLMRQERLVTTGTLAAGVGHEINNPLSYVMANLDFSMDELRAISGATPPPRVAELIQVLAEAREGAERIRKIVRGLRAFAREEPVSAPTDVRAAIEMSINMAMHELRQKASVTTKIDDVPMILGDEARLSQVVVNLLVNAAQAFPKSNVAQNHITVRTYLATDGRVAIEVSDNGPGIPEETLSRIFDPFFTTKPLGVGTGLGLSICHSVVTALGGEIQCETKLGEGTTFRVLIPTTIEPTVTTVGPASMLPRGRVLVVDDEEAVLKSVARLLQAQHDVVAVSDSRDALRLLLDPRERFDVVFCDLMMPHFTGMDVHSRVKEANPELAERFVFITGGAVREDIRAFLNEVPNERLDKPFSSQNLRGIARRFFRK